ncbi:hypothetical protein F2P81_011067 [Scophthalmus maximus]|uniref:Uncharacterized protein n=1 Tax=Scophthalmus maximus TaxID=52904 RepID=A0A6A4SSX6_SCOMX|nr:hypothetical protein F2P81_011067 [Scophthalmus maximus]
MQKDKRAQACIACSSSRGSLARSRQAPSVNLVSTSLLLLLLLLQRRGESSRGGEGESNGPSYTRSRRRLRPLNTLTGFQLV